MIENPTYIFLYTDGYDRSKSRGKHIFSKNILNKTADNYANEPLSSILPNINMYEGYNRLKKCYTLITTDEEVALMIQLDPSSILNEKAKKNFTYCGSIYLTKEILEIYNELVELTKINTCKINELNKSIESKQNILLSLAHVDTWTMIRNYSNSLTKQKFDYSISNFKTSLRKKSQFIENDLDLIDTANKNTFDLLNNVIFKIMKERDDIESNYNEEKEKLIKTLSQMGFKI